jgi:glycerophosphoryl diester phosphodiesterase
MAHAAISAHSGGSDHDPADTPPDTYASYRAAADTGAEYVEIDIRRTRDSVLVAYHDEHCGPPDRAVADLDYAEMCERAGYRVPRAAEVMDMLAGRVSGHLDLKLSGYEVEAVGLALETFGPAGFVATTLEDASVALIRREFPEVRTALSLGSDLDRLPARRRAAARLSEVFPVRRLRACGAQWAALNYLLAHAGVLRRCAVNGFGTMLWTVDRDGQIARFLKDPRVDVVVTNHPKRALALRDALSDTSDTSDRQRTTS